MKVENNKILFFAIPILSLFVYLLVYLPVVESRYAYHDDWYLWSFEHGDPLEKNPLFNALKLMGRPIAAWLVVGFSKSIVHTVQDVSYLRLISAVNFSICASLFTFWLIRLKVEPVTAFLISVGLFLTPPAQATIVSSTSFTLTFILLFSIISGFLLDQIDIKGIAEKRWPSTRDWFYFATSIIALLATMFIYPATSMFYVVFPLSLVLFCSYQNRHSVFLKALLYIFVLSATSGLYFLLHRYLYLPYLFKVLPDAELIMRSYGSYTFVLITIGGVFERIIHLFFETIMIKGSDLIGFHFIPDKRIVVGIWCVIFSGCVLAGMKQYFGPSENGRKLNMLLTYHFPALLIVIAIPLLANTPNLVAASSKTIFQTLIPHSAIVFILLSWALMSISSLFNEKIKTHLTRALLVMLVTMLSISSQHNTSRAAQLESNELKHLEAKIGPNLKDDPVIYLRLGRDTLSETLCPTTFVINAHKWIIRYIYLEHGQLSLYAPHKVTFGGFETPIEKPSSGKLVIDIASVVEQFYPHAVNESSFYAENYFGYDIVKIPKGANLYYIVPAGQYDNTWQACRLGGCSSVFGANTPELVKQWIADNRTSVIASSDSGGDLLVKANRVTESVPVWHSQSPPKYPEWIQVDHFPSVVTGFSMQTPPMAANDAASPSKMPRNFIFQGSLDGVNWTDLYKAEGVVFTRGEEHKEWKFRNRVAYDHYRLYITANNASPTSPVGIYHLKLISRTPSGSEELAVPESANASSELDPSLSGANLANVEGNSPPWHSQKPAKFPEWVSFTYNKPEVLNRLHMQSQPTDGTGNPQLGRAPKDFTIQGSQNGQEWTDLLRIRNVQFNAGWEWKMWDFDNDIAYKHYRISIHDTNGDPTLVSIYRVKFGSVD